MTKITRDQLRAAIEAGIADAPGLTEREAEALRRVGESATRVARAVCEFDGCGCPAVQAGLARADELPEIIDTFATGFDRATHALTAPGFGIMTPERHLLVIA